VDEPPAGDREGEAAEEAAPQRRVAAGPRQQQVDGRQAEDDRDEARSELGEEAHHRRPARRLPTDVVVHDREITRSIFGTGPRRSR